MNVVELPLDRLREALWNPNQMDGAMLGRLKESISRYGIVENLVVRPLEGGAYEVLCGNQRLNVLKNLGLSAAPCVVVDLDDPHARLLAQALNVVHGEDDLGLRAELVREVLERLPLEEVLSVLPETSESLQALSSLGQEDMAEYLVKWQRAQKARLRHLQFQLTVSQLEVIEDALRRMVPMAKEEMGDSPNVRGTALYLLCKAFLEKEETP